MWPFKKEEKRLGPAALAGIFASFAASAAALWYFFRGKNKPPENRNHRSSHHKH